MRKRNSFLQRLDGIPPEIYSGSPKPHDNRVLLQYACFDTHTKSHFNYEEHSTIFNHFYIYKDRAVKEKVKDLMDSLAEERWLEWRLSQPIDQEKEDAQAKAIWKLKLAQRAANYITSLPGKKVKQRDLQRHLRVKVSDLDEIKGILASYYMIFTSDRGGV
jgi:hypothetical protein